MVTILHPDFRKGFGEKASDRAVYLDGAAAEALQVWSAIYANRQPFGAA